MSQSSRKLKRRTRKRPYRPNDEALESLIAQLRTLQKEGIVSDLVEAHVFSHEGALLTLQATRGKPSSSNLHEQVSIAKSAQLDFNRKHELIQGHHRAMQSLSAAMRLDTENAVRTLKSGTSGDALEFYKSLEI